MRTFSVKFSDDQTVMIRLLAEQNGQTVSQFIRERVLGREDLIDVLVHMQSTLLITIADGFRERDRADKSTPNNDTHTALLLEAVLRLRTVSNPTATRAIFAEMERLGVPPFIAK